MSCDWRLVWLCEDIIAELEKKYPKGWMDTLDHTQVFELFQCKECKRMVKATAIGGDNVISIDEAKRHRELAEKVRQKKAERGDD